MIQFNPVDVYIFTHAMDQVHYVYEKYSHLSDLLDIDMKTSFKRGLATIINKKDYRFHKMLQKVEYSFEADFDTIIEQISKILGYYLEGKYVDISRDESTIRINDLEFNVNEYVEIIPDQELIIEFLLLTIFNNRADRVEKIIEKSGDKFKNHTIFTADEAAEFTNYKKSYIYKMHSEGKIKAGQTKPGGKLKFRRKELEDFMFRFNSTEDLTY